MKRLLLLITIMTLIVLSCQKEPNVETSKFSITNEEIAIGTTSVVVTVTYSYPSVLERVDGYISQSSDMNNSNNVRATINQNTFVIRFVNLSANTRYYYQFEYSTGMDVNKTDISSFTTNDYALPNVVTADITNITATSAICGGEVLDDGGLEVTERGVCWSISPNPNISNEHANFGDGVGSFTCDIINLSSYTTYYVRAYATNDKGTNYGEQKIFNTLLIGHEGAINSVFSVSAQKQVSFSQGNLQYQASTNTWRFADNQWDFVGSTTVSQGQPAGTVTGSSNHCISSTYDGWVDLFGWGTSGYNHGAAAYQPYSQSQFDHQYYAYGNQTCNLDDHTGMADWGYNSISNGGNTENSWHTLSFDEWKYVFNLRNTVSGSRFVKATVNGVQGIVLLPDNWINTIYDLTQINNASADFSNNTIAVSEWQNKLELNGAVFLPNTGMRSGSAGMLIQIGSGNYWSSSCINNTAQRLRFSNQSINLDYNNNYDRANGYSVRLVYYIE